MPTTKSATPQASAPGARRPWEAPGLTELALGVGTRTPNTDGHDSPVPCPQPPRPTESKPGLSIEWSFPMAYRDK